MIMTCRILARSCYVKLSSNNRMVGSLLAKWPSHVVASASVSGTTTISRWSQRLSQSAAPHSVGSVADLRPQLLSFNNRSPAWQSDSLSNVRSAFDHLQQAAWPEQKVQRYCTQSRGDGSASTSQVAGEVAGASAQGQLTQREKLKRAVKEYGSTVIVFHITISLASLGGFYLAVSSGIDMVGILKSVGIGESILQSKLATGTGTFVVAYAVHKVFAPVRIAITLTCTPFIVRYLRGKGILKPPKTKA